MPAEVVEWPDRLNPTDALFWLMDKIPEMRSTTGALLLLERAPSHKRIRAAFRRMCENLPRLRQRVVPVPLALAPPEWVDDPQFDLDYHLRYVAVSAPGSLDNLLEELSPLYATALDPERPLWEAYVVEGLLDGRGAVFVKLHHCVTDDSAALGCSPSCSETDRSRSRCHCAAHAMRARPRRAQCCGERCSTTWTTRYAAEPVRSVRC